MVHINGKDMDVAGQSLMAYLEANDYEKGTFVVECKDRKSTRLNSSHT